MNEDQKKAALIEEARDAEAEGDSRRSTACLEQAVDIDPHDPALWTMLGHSYADREQYAAALQAFDRATTVDPSFAAAHSGKAQAMESMGRLHDAEASMLRAINIEPTAARYVLLADIQAGRFRDDEARASLREALGLDPSDDEALFNLAVLTRHDPDGEAEALLRRAIEVDPLFAAAHRELGFELVRKHDHRGAEEALRTARQLEPEDPWVHLYLGNVLWAQGEVAEAEAEFSEACRIRPLWSVPHWLIGLFYKGTGQVHRADTHFRLATTNDPKDPDAAYQLGHYLLDLGLRDEGRLWIARALELDPNHPRARAAGRDLGVW